MRWADYKTYGFWTHSVLWSKDGIMLGWCFAQNNGTVIWEVESELDGSSWETEARGVSKSRKEAKREVRKLVRAKIEAGKGGDHDVQEH